MGTTGNISEIKIPFGLGISGSYRFSKKIIMELGVMYKNEGEKTEESSISLIRPGGYYGKVFHQFTYKYIDFPLHINYSLFKYKFLDFQVFAGVKGTIFFYDDYWNPFFDGNEYDEKTNKFEYSYFFGAMQFFNISDRLGLFASQYTGSVFKYPLEQDARNDRIYSLKKMLDLKLGISYKFGKP